MVSPFLLTKVATFWILLNTLANTATSLSNCSSLQFRPTLHNSTHFNVNSDIITSAVELCTVYKQSCICDFSKMNLTSDQKLVLKKLYKNGGKIEKSKSNISFLAKCLEFKVIPSSFKLKNTLPGSKVSNQEKLNKISFESICEEKQKHSNTLIGVKKEFDKCIKQLEQVFDEEKAATELKNVQKHLRKIENLNQKQKKKKFDNLIKNADVTIASDDGISLPAHRNERANVTTVSDDGVPSPALNSIRKRKRKFKRRYMQPQPKKHRKRKRNTIGFIQNVLEDPENNTWNGVIKNFSGEAITKVEEGLFSKGKKFCPVELDPPVVRFQNELDGFFRNLRIQWVFQDSSDKRTELEKLFYQKSDWQPPPACLEIENMISRIQENFDKWSPPKNVKDNLSRDERILLKDIMKNPNIVYMWEDKGASFTKMTRDQYVQLGEKELEKDSYLDVEEDPSANLKLMSDRLISKMHKKGEISDKVAEFLCQGEQNLSKFYHVIKTHKISTESESPEVLPVRGIISTKSSPLERLGGLVDYFLKPGMENLPTFLQDTKHVLLLIEELNERIDRGELSLDGVALVSMDIESMYTNMSLELGRNASKEYLNSRNSHNVAPDNLKVTTKSVLEALELCVKNNYFQFDSKIYKQKDGVGTGNKMAPPFTCLGVGKFEDLAFASNQELLELVLLWKRYIDDILMLFKGSEDQCQELVTWLNSLMPGIIKFKFEYSNTSIEFLDLTIRIENGRLETDLFVKPTNLQLFLDYFSNHPQHCKEGIVYSQALRVIERCSRPEDMNKNLNILKEKLLQRNFPNILIDKKFEQAKSMDRKQILRRKPKSKCDNKVRGIFTHNKGGPPIHQWIREGKKQLIKNEKAKSIGDRIQIGWKQPKNLQRMVCGLKAEQRTPQVENPGCWKCGKCRVACPILTEGTTFSSTNTKKTYVIRKSLTCTSKFVVYLATCLKCGGQYVGKSTTPFKTRHSNHKQEIRNSIGGLGNHYGGNGCGYNNLRIQIIDQVEAGNTRALAESEIYWQHQLRVYIQNGGQAHCRRKEKS